MHLLLIILTLTLKNAVAFPFCRPFWASLIGRSLHGGCVCAYGTHFTHGYAPAPLTQLDSMGEYPPWVSLAAARLRSTHGYAPTPLSRLYIPLIFGRMQKSAEGTTGDRRGWSERRKRERNPRMRNTPINEALTGRQNETNCVF